MSKHTWQQWSAVGAFIVYMVSLAGMFTFKSSDVAFFGLLGVQMLSVAWIGILLHKWPQGGFK